MSGIFQSLRRALGFSNLWSRKDAVADRVVKDFTRFAEGDRALIDGARLSAPLQRNSKSDFQRGALLHNDILGKPLVPFYAPARSGKGGLYKIEYPSLDQYVSLTPRLVTPVYSNYASTIVSQLDIHPVPFDETTASQGIATPKLEILEAGTGHGSLTLHIARAIAAANPPPPQLELPQIQPVDPQRPELAAKLERQNALNAAWKNWKDRRPAVLHTVEKVVANRFHAEKIVRGFRQALYWPHVDFYAGDVKEWIAEQFKLRLSSKWNPLSRAEDSFLDYVLLDMPGVHHQLKHVHSAMHEGAKLVVFVPSVTQIGDCAGAIQDGSLPLSMEKVLELGEGISSGRRWDVRMVMPRRQRDAPDTSGSAAAGDPVPRSEKPAEAANTDSDREPGLDSADAVPAVTVDESQDEPVMVCRPLVGERTFGGGFIALFRKVSPESAATAVEWRRGQTGWAKKRHR
ncbi:hypothetical protein HRR83_001189 [Exophiala dermatitidis]|uniref:tRNA (adenine(58)-N(1))-methyltransferase catalytic subunit TRM61 n=2 Tax=Exophiala dermatitidis TaxID=5970 RepID=H6C737_EXODN|nr:uncharacterized protein HMPREF1120_07521 [Exophiala dermatitidis NIH/UT8656]KAJ4522699.1 hypothetical protein HRR75_001093 [Exophiala dermatitidis]EHY59533.1 hypothetical protein HMPREF1120_07521 [Exophiala dermatitidis NIH/UT8656]KAJ4526000.1 hypothetical protein HRR74_001193 [Exophiala dermatitidis]KAJ4527054.1 hypothetical protein HRR73_001851 [Exophiala dermatitidis]KAJ4532772.1 hypothetical protein HRR76_007753 [Exophiala dermatitidis]